MPARAPRFFPSPAAFRAWLERHHARETELQVGFWKVGTGRPSLTWSESVDEAICFGWIDGVRRSLDAERYLIRFTPRSPKSSWSALNRRKAEALLAAGRMAPAGRRAWALRPEAEDASHSFETRASPRLSPKHERSFRAARAAWAWFQGRPPGYRRTAVHWVVSAKREETRARRLAQLIASSAAGRTIPPLTPPSRRW
jgi:uncharacterized protein YdeI (YjbR/CyaY-like superfamily)